MASSETSYTKPQRLHFDDEARFAWLSILLNAYHIIDKGVNAGIQAQLKKGRSIACAKGCSSCCTSHVDIPVYPLEMMGMSWFVIEQLKSPMREKLKQQLEQLNQIESCPFLIEGSCSIHPVRPIACRQFNVLDKPCDIDEDAFHTRKKDVMMPIKLFADQAYNEMLPFYGIKKKSERVKALKQGVIHSQAKVMRDCHWQNLPSKMEQFDKN